VSLVFDIASTCRGGVGFCRRKHESHTKGPHIKLLSHKRKIYLDRRSRVQHVERCHRSIYRSKPEAQYLESLSDRGDTWTAPKIFSLVPAARGAFLRSLAILRKRIGLQRRKTIVDFSQTEKMSAEGTLLFLAEFKRLLRHVKGEVEITGVLPHNNKVAQVLCQIGVLELLGITTSIVPVDDDVVNWKTAYGTQVEGKKYDDILQAYDGDIADLLQDKLYAGITEAMTNVLNHAYDLPRADGLDAAPLKEWWMFSQQQHGKLVIVFCDLGAGIPRTLPIKRASVWRRVLSLGKTSDSDVIRYAVEDSVTRTMKDYRGKGLGQIVRVIRGIEDAEVHICSNRGVFTERHGARASNSTYNDSILGTLIFWRIPLHDKEAT